MTDLGLVGADSDSFHDLDNHFVAEVWRKADEAEGGGTLPMTLVSIFCSLIRRLPISKELKIRAKPIGFPGKLLAGLAYEVEGGGEEEWTFVDVFGGRVLQIDEMRAMLRAMQLPASPEYFRPASAREMVRSSLSPPFLPL
jgi:hypothetical protein